MAASPSPMVYLESVLQTANGWRAETMSNQVNQIAFTPVRYARIIGKVVSVLAMAVLL